MTLEEFDARNMDVLVAESILRQKVTWVRKCPYLGDKEVPRYSSDLREFTKMAESLSLAVIVTIKSAIGGGYEVTGVVEGPMRGLFIFPCLGSRTQHPIPDSRGWTSVTVTKETMDDAQAALATELCKALIDILIPRR